MSLTVGADFEAALLAAVRQAVAGALARVRGPLEERTRVLVREAILRSPEAASLLGGDLRQMFGLDDPAGVVEGIAEAVAAGVHAVVTPPAGDVLGGLVVVALRDDMREALDVRGAEYLSVRRRTGESNPVPWLRWLLTEGQGPVREIIAGFEYKLVGPTRGSRAGEALMVQPKKYAARGFAVPPAFAGTADDNWLTRSLAAVGEELGPAVAEMLAEF